MDYILHQLHLKLDALAFRGNLTIKPYSTQFTQNECFSIVSEHTTQGVASLRRFRLFVLVFTMLLTSITGGSISLCRHVKVVQYILKQRVPAIS